jgi:hypothetical protein
VLQITFTDPNGWAVNAWVCGRSLAGIADSNLAGGMDVSLVNVVCCQVEVGGPGHTQLYVGLPPVRAPWTVTIYFPHFRGRAP